MEPIFSAAEAAPDIRSSAMKKRGALEPEERCSIRLACARGEGHYPPMSKGWRQFYSEGKKISIFCFREGF